MSNCELNYSDIILSNPMYSEIESRDLVDTSVKFGDHVFKIPAFPANMKTAIDFKLAESLARNGYFYILHRFYKYVDILKWLIDNQNKFTLSISVGVKGADYDLIDEICYHQLKVDYITVDVAHGHHILVRNMIEYIRNKLGKSIYIIAGNVCTPEACCELYCWGADAVKVGLAMGAGCSTYNSTGVGSPMFSAVLKCAERSPIPVIADGGIRQVGDVCKALVAGATMVMVGSEFVKCCDSPAENVYEKGDEIIKWHPRIIYKKYYGSASSTNGGKKKYIEGWGEVLLPCNKMLYLDYCNKIRDGIASCLSYHNSRNLDGVNTIKWNILK
jgi:GMP reductase